MISGFSVISAATLYSIMLLLVGVLRRWTPLMKRGGTSALLTMAVLGVARLVLPIEVSAATAIRSWTVLGKPQRFLREHTTVTNLLLAVWIISAVVFVGLSIFSVYYANKRCRSYIVVEDETVQKIARRLSIPCPVVVSPDVEVPYVAGFFRHTIYCPVLDIPENRLELALAHEAQHIRTHDALVKLVFGLVSAVMWWNPAVILFGGEIDVLLEMRCDVKVTEHMDIDGRREYGEMLKDVARQVLARRGMRSPALSESRVLGKKGGVLKQRTKVILRENREPRVLRALLNCVVVALFCASFLVIAQGAGAPMEENFEEQIGVSYHESFDGPDLGDVMNNAFIVKQSDGRYRLFIDYRFSRYLTEDEITSDLYKDLYIFEEEIEE